MTASGTFGSDNFCIDTSKCAPVKFIAAFGFASGGSDYLTFPADGYMALDMDDANSFVPKLKAAGLISSLVVTSSLSGTPSITIGGYGTGLTSTDFTFFSGNAFSGF